MARHTDKRRRPTPPRNAAPAAPTPPADATAGDLLDMDQAIAALKTTRPTFYRLLRAGKIKGMKVGRQWRFYRDDLERFLKGEGPRIDVAGDLGELLATLRERFKASGITKFPEGRTVLDALSAVILYANHARVSDIHVQPGESRGLVRVRIDGVLHALADFDPKLLPALIEQLKIMANCNPAEKHLPQDGRIQLSVSENRLDIRISFLPALHGEAATLRLLRPADVAIDLARVISQPADLERFRKALSIPWGLIMVTGPTGSGKTTTLYAALHEVNTPNRKVMSAEEPVEYTFNNVVQVAINARAGLTFPVALRSILRADPDVIMVGELRDEQTAQVCAQMALTGHLVLTSMHTEDAVGAIQRLLDLGVDPGTVVDVVKFIVSQRLVRALCRECSVPTDEPLPPSVEGIAREGGLDWTRHEKSFRKAVGCKACNFTGYRGRIGVIETLEMTPALAAAIRRRAPLEEMRKLAVSQGMVTLPAEAIRRAATGKTSMEEALRLTPPA